jgi:hypothetical protein
VIKEEEFKSNKYIRIISSYCMLLLGHVNAQVENSFIKLFFLIKIIIMMTVEIMIITITITIQVVMIIFLR